ncbi:unnamed protein product [Acanthoscelides obtectus]|uniref:Uncharacterized protein n=1 Tax=Acanthoscelides obtectus TaxID=200917 RepID=A0A9P0LC38_ACAOB|nr:unnamed protein product [Acanthoscelides obtectus]CAK1651644.1 hypothetical protein AOBTE_LOCUS17373 [Acanthoscelides obtectus]
MLLPSSSKKEKVIQKKRAIVDSSSSDEEEVDTNFSLASSSSLNLSEEEKPEDTTSANLRSFQVLYPKKMILFQLSTMVITAGAGGYSRKRGSLYKMHGKMWKTVAMARKGGLHIVCQKRN